MTEFEQYLIEQGFKRHREENGKIIPIETGYAFSSATPGQLDYRYIKGDRQVVFGLSEAGKPPTLISPRLPYCYGDDDTNRVLRTQSPEDIYKMLFNNLPHDSKAINR